MTIVAGPERRSADRLQLEGQTGLPRRAVAYAMLTALALWLAVWLVLAVGATLYLVKSALGIDLLEGDSPLHFLYDWVLGSSAPANSFPAASMAFTILA